MTNYLSTAIAKATKKNKTWPGLPLTQLPVQAKVDLDAALATGEVRIVSRPGIMGGTVDFIVKVA